MGVLGMKEQTDEANQLQRWRLCEHKQQHRRAVDDWWTDINAYWPSNGQRYSKRNVLRLDALDVVKFYIA